MNRLLPFCLLACGVLLFSSCKRAQLNRDTTSAEDNALAQTLWDDVGNQVESSATHAEYDSTQTRSWGACATLTLDTTPGVFPMTITLDFGEENCEGADGRMRRGKLIYTLSNTYRNEGTSMTVTTDDYFVNDYKVEGTRTVVNKGKNTNDQWVFQITVEDGLIITPENENISWISERTRTWIEGSETGLFTPDGNGGFLGIEGILDDAYDVSGTAQGTDRDGRSFSVATTNPLRVRINCRWITMGTLELEPEDLEKRIVDYGADECDRQADVTIDGNTYSITLGG